MLLVFLVGCPLSGVLLWALQEHTDVQVHQYGEDEALVGFVIALGGFGLLCTALLCALHPVWGIGVWPEGLELAMLGGRRRVIPWQQVTQVDLVWLKLPMLWPRYRHPDLRYGFCLAVRLAGEQPVPAIHPALRKRIASRLGISGPLIVVSLDAFDGQQMDLLRTIRAHAPREVPVLLRPGPDHPPMPV